jgi:hypothetical protein
MFSKNKTLLACTLWLTCFQVIPAMAQTSATEVEAAYPDGQLELFKGDDLKCTMPFKQGTYPLNVEGPCKDSTWDDVDRFRVVGVPSASTFTLFDDERCANRSDQAYIYTFKVVKNPTTMQDSMPIGTAGATQLGELVYGTTLRMEYRLYNREARDLLGCVQIKRSATPED